jgi:hypothetical protein
MFREDKGVKKKKKRPILSQPWLEARSKGQKMMRAQTVLEQMSGCSGLREPNQ